MKQTLRNTIEGFVYAHLEYFTSMVYEHGEDTVFKGIKVLDDKEKFTQGALVNAASLLYAYYVRTNNDKSEDVLKRLHFFIKLAASTKCKTWGKIGILRGFNILFENGLLDKVDPEYIELVKEKTDYDDFFDKDKLETRSMATNYIHVAMACAGYREKFGWENDGYADKIKDKLSGIIFEGNDHGWMDDGIPYGRFDRYSLILTSEFFDTAADTNLDIPKQILDNLSLMADISLFMANRNGDGILFGRSVPAHGDATCAEALASALAAKLVKKEDIPTALAYIMQTSKKMINFWYEADSKSFNMWWDGRTTNYYRGIGRILEVNLDLANHLCTILKNLERAELADTEISIENIYSPEEWRILPVVFSKDENGVKECIFMRKGDLLISLTFTGHGNGWGKRSAYYAFPVISQITEASPIAELPFFIPEYTDPNGKKLHPCQYFKSVDVTETNGKTLISVKGNLSYVETNLPQKSDYDFDAIYVLSGGVISAEFKTAFTFPNAEMITGKVSDMCHISAYGFDTSKKIDTENRPDFDGVHRKIFDANLHTVSNANVLGYSIDFSEYFNQNK